MTLDESFKHRGKLTKLDGSFVHADILKRRTSASGNVSIRRSYSADALGNRPWVVDLNGNESHEFESVEEAESFAMSNGLVMKGRKAWLLEGTGPTVAWNDPRRTSNAGNN